MTVKELVEELKKFDEDIPVYVVNLEWGIVLADEVNSYGKGVLIEGE